MDLSFNQNRDIEHHLKNTNSSHQQVFSEIGLCEVEEEFHTSDDQVENVLSNRLAANYSLYLTASRHFIYKDYSKNNKIVAPLSVNSIPIYLRIGVLKI
jgi:hypothetical protein